MEIKKEVLCTQCRSYVIVCCDICYDSGTMFDNRYDNIDFIDCICENGFKIKEERRLRRIEREEKRLEIEQKLKEAGVDAFIKDRKL